MNLRPQKQSFREELYSLIDQISKDLFYSKIIESAVFQRLQHISFLGAINYTHPCLKQKSIEKSRFCHSLWVAGLAKFISNKRGYDREIEKHIVTAALLHDIGHGPLSHSIEPAFKEKWGIGHHQTGREVILGQHSIGRELSKTIRESLDLELVLDLIDGNSTEAFVDLFNSPVNIDTIDGITRCYGYARKAENHHYNLLEITEASFIKTKANREKILDDFWKLKDTMYRIFILSRSGYKADTVCRMYFEENVNSFDKSEWFSNEKIWKKKYRPLFKTLRDYREFAKFDLFGKSIKLKAYRREYNINTSIMLKDSSSMKSRYVCKKYKTYYTTNSFHNAL